MHLSISTHISPFLKIYLSKNRWIYYQIIFDLASFNKYIIKDRKDMNQMNQQITKFRYNSSIFKFMKKCSMRRKVEFSLTTCLKLLYFCNCFVWCLLPWNLMPNCSKAWRPAFTFWTSRIAFYIIGLKNQTGTKLVIMQSLLSMTYSHDHNLNTFLIYKYVLIIAKTSVDTYFMHDIDINPNRLPI